MTATASARGALLGRTACALTAVLAASAATSWMQFLLVAVRRDVFGLFSWKWWHRDQMFLSAVGYLLLFAIVSLAPLALHLRWPRRYSFAAFVATLGGLGAFFVLLVFERVHPVAWLAVGGGVGVQLYRVMAPRPASTWRWTWRTALLGHLASAVVVGWQAYADRSRETDAMRALPPARDGAPNVLLIVLDTERAKDLSLYGASDSTTPHLAAWGRTGVVFDAAYSTSSWTLPSHTSLFTGHYPSQTSIDWMAPLDGARRTLAEAFRGQGYATGGFVANVNFVGFRTGLGRGFIRFEDTRRSLRQILLGTTLMQSGSAVRWFEAWDEVHWLKRAAGKALRPVILRPIDGVPAEDLKRADEVSRDFLEWTSTLQDRPYFAFLNLFDAHGPYLPPAPYRTMFDSAAGPHGRYRGAIRYMDDEVNRLLLELKRRGTLRNTIVVVTSDHGEMFGENHLIGHGNGLYRPQLHVPLVVLNAPGAVPGTRVTQRTSLRDLPVTLLDLADVPDRTPFGGVSLRPLLAGAASLPDASPVLAELTPSFNPRARSVVKTDQKSLIDDDGHVVATADGEYKIFAYPGDTLELEDLGTSQTARGDARDRLARVMGTLGIRWQR